MIIRKIYNKVFRLWNRRTSDAYCCYLRKIGVKIGKIRIINPNACNIDITRPSLVEIGDNVVLNDNFTLLTHDFVSGIFVNAYNDFLPSSGRVKIGNNVRFGVNCIVLKGVSIGDNCFIGAGSIVTKDIPSGSVVAGVPAKVICKMDYYYERRKNECIKEAFIYAKSIKERYRRAPKPEDFWEEFPLFVDKNNINDFPNFPIKKQLGNSYEKWLTCHKAMFNSFDDFIDEATK